MEKKKTGKKINHIFINSQSIFIFSCNKEQMSPHYSRQILNLGFPQNAEVFAHKFEQGLFPFFALCLDLCGKLSPWPSNHKLFFVTAVKIYH